MLSFTGGLKVLVAVEACDMRKGYEGLTAMVEGVLSEELRSGILFLSLGTRGGRGSRSSITMGAESGY